MAEYKLLLPSMGEGVMEATIISWLFNEGDFIKEDDSVVEIATDKVDSDVPTPVSGKIVKILKQKDEVAKIGEAIAILETEGGSQDSQEPETKSYEEVKDQIVQPEPEVVSALEQPLSNYSDNLFSNQNSDIYLSPLVKSIVQEEKISESELKSIKGSGLEGRITKEDILGFLQNRGAVQSAPAPQTVTQAVSPVKSQPAPAQPISVNEGDEIVTNGAFTIDASAQLEGKRSMMNENAPGTAPMTGHQGHSMSGMSGSHAVSQESEHVLFAVRGSCDMCKERIEKAAKGVNGVLSAHWDKDTQMIHLQYDPQKTSPKAISKAIAKVGHDTDMDKADKAVYDKLPACCHYR